MRKVIFSISLLLIGLQLMAQVGDLMFSGQLVDEYAGDPIVGATLILSNEDHSFESISTVDGTFSFSSLPAGYYRLTMTSLGYQSKVIAEVEINSGVPKDQVFTMSLATESLDEVVIKAQSRNRSGDAVNSIYTLTVEESFRFPGTFYDPARLAANYAGVISENDQANNLVVRGNSPNGLGWYLQGVEIVNPNHTANAGTLNDRSSQSGGGVNMLSAQMLDNSTFLTSAFPATYGNATTGILDMQLREGSRDEFHFTGQMGLTGIDAAAEGPMGVSKGGSYLFNYRYSTLGILSSLGVDLGDEAINFQDLSLNLNWRLKNAAKISIFGLAGNSKNVFESPEDPADIEEFKDLQNITFKGKMATAGIQYRSRSWEHTLAYSGFEHTRESQLLDDAQFLPFENDLTTEQRVGLHSRKTLLLKEGNLVFGLRANWLSYQLQGATYPVNLAQENEQQGALIQPYVDLRKSIAARVDLHAGVHVTTFSLNNSSAFEPRVGLSYRNSTKSRFGFSYGLHSRIASTSALLSRSSTGTDNTNLDLIRSHHFVISHQYQVSNSSKFITEFYYQHLFDLPVAAGPDRSLSTINAIDYIASEDLVSDGTGDNMGVELTFQQYFTNSTYLLLTGTFYDSKYVSSDGIKRNTHYNGKYGFNLTGGKEFDWKRNGKIKVIGLNLRGVAFGGFWEGPVDVDKSIAAYRTIYDEAAAFTEQLPGFFKIDFRVYYKRVKPKFTSILGLDLLNATNQQNIAFHYYDFLKEEISEKYHLGLIPNLSYRIEF